jgi:hypothetical protein
VNPFLAALRTPALHRAVGLLVLSVALPSTLVACSDGGDDTPSTGGASGSGGNTGGSGGTTGGSGGSGGTGGASSGTGGTGGAAPQLHGSFTFEVVEETGGVVAFTRFFGALFEAPYPPSFPLTLDSTDGDCELWVPTNASCPMGCSGGVCTAAGVCSPFPKEASGGVVTLDGIEGGQFMVSPATARLSYQATAALPNPPCVESSTFSISGTGFSADAKCIRPLVLTSAVPIPVMSGSPVELAWEPGTEASARINVKLDIAHHGGRKGEIQCDVADTGTFAIPAALVTKLVNLGLAGFPTIGLKRIVKVAATGQPGISLVMSAPLERAVDTGVQSCSESTDCDDGETCTDAKICE